MKITGVVAHPVSAALPYAFWTAAEPLTRQEFVVVEVRADEGLVGYGHAYGSPLSLVASCLVLRDRKSRKEPETRRRAQGMHAWGMYAERMHAWDRPAPGMHVADRARPS